MVMSPTVGDDVNVRSQNLPKKIKHMNNNYKMAKERL